MPMGGLWRVSFSLGSGVHTGDTNYAYLYYNGQRMEETLYQTNYGGSDKMWSTGGREVMVRAQQGDTLHLGASLVGYKFYKIISCFQFIN